MKRIAWFVMLLLLVGCDKSTQVKFDVSGTVDIAVEDGGSIPPPPPPPPGTGSFTTNGSLAGVKLLTDDSGWYTRVDAMPVHEQSQAIILAQPTAVTGLYRLQNDWGPDFGIPYAVGRGFPAVPINVTTYPGESDLGPRPIPLDAPIEPGPDKHLLYVDLDSQFLFEMGMASREGQGFACEAIAAWNLNKSYDQRPLGNTSADAAGLPILPGLVTVDQMLEALAKPNPDDQHLGHALRFTIPNTGHGFIAPARHYASVTPYSLPSRPPMGMRVRINPNLDLSQFNKPTQVLMRTLQRYGGILADNGAAWFVTGTADARWGEPWGTAADGSRYSLFDAVTGVVDGKKGLKSYTGADFISNFQVLEIKDVITAL